MLARPPPPTAVPPTTFDDCGDDGDDDGGGDVVFASVPSSKNTASLLSFQPWFVSPRSLATYPRKPSPSLSPCSSIQRTAASTCGHSSAIARLSPVDARY